MHPGLSTLLSALALLPIQLGGGDEVPRRRAGAGKRNLGVPTGLVPLVDLGEGRYRGFEGGLYPGGADEPPAAHAEAALAEGRSIVPRDPTGRPDPEAGLIGMVGVGLSTTCQVFAAYERVADADPGRNPRLVLINGARAGNSAEIMLAEGSGYWEELPEIVAAHGVAPAQVQVAWVSQRNAPGRFRRTRRRRSAPGQDTVPGFDRPRRKERGGDEPPGRTGPAELPVTDFPEGAELLRDSLRSIVRRLRATFPNLRLCYLSDRMPWPEPAAYEDGFAVKWLIAEQIAGAEDLAWDPERGDLAAPLLLWGPYLWADGERPNSRGVRWFLEDYEPDGSHPSAAGERKVAGLLSRFFARNPTTVPWYRRGRSGARPVVINARDDAFVDARRPEARLGSSERLETTGGKKPARIYLRFDLSRLERPVLHAKLSLRLTADRRSGAPQRVSAVPGADWDERTLCFARAPGPGEPVGVMPRANRGGTRALDVTRAVNACAGDDLTLVLESDLSFDSRSFCHSREGGPPPRLVIAPAATPGAPPKDR